jgi:hypothetical protein
MGLNLILHSSVNINCSKVLSAFNNGQRYFKKCNTYLIPYHCQEINYTNRIIIGSFVYPMWNSLERLLLSNGCIFNYTYIKGDNHSFVYKSDELKILSDYHISGKNKIHKSTVKINDKFLKPNTILLFPIHKTIAEPFKTAKLL